MIFWGAILAVAGPRNQPLPMRTVGAVIFPGFQLLDLYGPLEMFGWLPEEFRVTLVAETAGAVESSPGSRSIADISIDVAPRFDILLVPGGLGTRREADNARLVDWIGRTAEQSDIVATVCTGAALLARTGLLEGRRATTNKRAYEWVVSQGPNVTWQPRARWVEDGKFWTSSGVSSGIDMTLAIIARLHGAEVANDVAAKAEYIWNSDAASDPFARS